MIHCFGALDTTVFAVQSLSDLTPETKDKLQWLFGNQTKIERTAIDLNFVGPRAAMITPWSTNAVEITQNMGVQGIIRIEKFKPCEIGFNGFDPMIYELFEVLDQESFDIDIHPEPILNIKDIAAYNKQEGLSLNDEEVDYLNNLCKKIGRPLTD